MKGKTIFFKFEIANTIKNLEKELQDNICRENEICKKAKLNKRMNQNFYSFESMCEYCCIDKSECIKEEYIRMSNTKNGISNEKEIKRFVNLLKEKINV